MTPKREQELFEKLDQLITLVRSNDARLTSVEGRLTALEATTAGTRQELADISKAVNHPNRGLEAIYDSLNNLREGVAEQRGEMRGRLEEQSRLLIALVPQKVAAVGNR